MPLSTGIVLQQRYRIVKEVGRGGFGAVYRAWDTSLGRAVAVKENLDTSPESGRQFEREARLLGSLRHPNLPVVGDHFILPGQGQYLVMDFVEGKSLDHVLQEHGGRLPEAVLLPWMEQVSSALTYLHTRQPPIIHRDIKPGNIIITDDRAMLVDFGISKIYDPNRLTTVGAKAVTPGLSPLEQYGRGKTDARSDVYALAATMYLLLTGHTPPEAPDLASRAETLQPVRSLNGAVSERTAAAIMRGLALHADDRPPSVAEFARQLVGPAAPQPAALQPAVPQPQAATPGLQATPARQQLPAAAPGGQPAAARQPMPVNAAPAAGAVGVGGQAAVDSSGAGSAQQAGCGWLLVTGLLFVAATALPLVFGGNFVASTMIASVTWVLAALTLQVLSRMRVGLVSVDFSTAVVVAGIWTSIILAIQVFIPMSTLAMLIYLVVTVITLLLLRLIVPGFRASGIGGTLIAAFAVTGVLVLVAVLLGSLGFSFFGDANPTTLLLRAFF